MIELLLVTVLVAGGFQDGAAAGNDSGSAGAESSQTTETAATAEVPATDSGSAGASSSQEAGTTPEGGATPAAPAKPAAKPPEPGFGVQQMFPFLIMGLLFYLMLIRPQQKEHRRRQELLKALKKNDRVVTSGGIVGVIADISSDGKMVTLKVDDSTRIKFLRSAIQGLYEEKSDSAAS